MIHELANTGRDPKLLEPCFLTLEGGPAVDMAGLVPETRKAFYALQEAVQQQLGFHIEPRSARRTCAEQAQLYAIGRNGDSNAKVTYARGCESWHVSGRAVDFDIYLADGRKSTSSADYRAVGELAEGLGWTWGGRFAGFGPNGDEGHVQWPWDGEKKLTVVDICPNPQTCVDVPATFDDPLEAGAGGIGLTTAALLAAGGVAVGLFLVTRR